MDIIELDRILTEINYYENFRSNFLYQDYNEIDYGKRLGRIKFNSFFDAHEKYTYSNHIEDDKFKKWNSILNNSDSTEEDILIVCLKVFDWGNVLTGNVKTAIDLYEDGRLKSYINWIKPLLSRNQILNVSQNNSNNFDVIWSSGWTKVYSFMNNNILIYDSRVSAFLNHTLISKYERLSDSEIMIFRTLAEKLFNFNGAQGRKRQVDKTFGFINQHPKGVNGFNANLISSWIVQLLNEKLQLNTSMRNYERAFFMLGFDLNQIEKEESAMK